MRKEVLIIGYGFLYFIIAYSYFIIRSVEKIAGIM